MGIGRFYRWISERYPLINEKINSSCMPEFDNLYLDMNGILHTASHGNSGGLLHATEEEMWMQVFASLNLLISTVKPRKVLVLAADGVAPRAKMNQQRARRYRAAKDAAAVSVQKKEEQRRLRRVRAEAKAAAERPPLLLHTPATIHNSTRTTSSSSNNSNSHSGRTTSSSSSSSGERPAYSHASSSATTAGAAVGEVASVLPGSTSSSSSSRGQEQQQKEEEEEEEEDERKFDSNCISPGTEFMAQFFTHLRFFCEKKLNEDPSWKHLNVFLSGPDVPGEGEHKIMHFIRSSKADPATGKNVRHCLYGLDADLIMLSLASHEPHFALLREEVFFGPMPTPALHEEMMTSSERLQLLHISLVREYLFLEFCTPSLLPPSFASITNGNHTNNSHSSSNINSNNSENSSSTTTTTTSTSSSSTSSSSSTRSSNFNTTSNSTTTPTSHSNSNNNNSSNNSNNNNSSNSSNAALCWKSSLLYPLEREHVIDDFVLFCFMVGNDFLPHPKAAGIAEGGLGRLMSCYRRYLQSYDVLAEQARSPRGPWLSYDCGKIDFCNLFLFLSLFVDTVEYEFLSEWAEDELWLQGKKETATPAALQIDDPVELYLHLFYLNKMNINSQTATGMKQRDDVALRYLEGLQWVLYYYYRGPCYSGWSWYYPYHYAPFIKDVLFCSFFTKNVKNLADLRNKSITFPPSKPCCPFIQLLSILPPQCKKSCVF